MPARRKSPRRSKSRSKSPRRVLKRRSSGKARTIRRNGTRSRRVRRFRAAELLNALNPAFKKQLTDILCPPPPPISDLAIGVTRSFSNEMDEQRWNQFITDLYEKGVSSMTVTFADKTTKSFTLGVEGGGHQQPPEHVTAGYVHPRSYSLMKSFKIDSFVTA